MSSAPDYVVYDPLAYDAACQVMIDLRQWQLAEESFLNAIEECRKQAPDGAAVAAETWRRAAGVREIRKGIGE